MAEGITVCPLPMHALASLVAPARAIGNALIGTDPLTDPPLRLFAHAQELFGPLSMRALEGDAEPARN